jgi:hypothetical protein
MRNIYEFKTGYVTRSAGKREWRESYHDRAMGTKPATGNAFRPIVAEGENAIYLEGSEESKLEDIYIRGLHYTMRDESGYPGGVFDTNPSARGVFIINVGSLSVPSLFLLDFKHSKNRTKS